MTKQKVLPCCGAHRSDYVVEGHGKYNGESFGSCRKCGAKLQTDDGTDIRIDHHNTEAEKERKRQAALPFYGEDQ